VDAWFVALPSLLKDVTARWRCTLGPAVPRGSVSVVFRCRAYDGQDAILKVSPDHPRLEVESAALRDWMGTATPRLLEYDGQLGALLMEAIKPGTSLIESMQYPAIRETADLLRSLHTTTSAGVGSYPPLAGRVEALFRSSEALYRAFPGSVEVLSRAEYERGRRFAHALAEDDRARVLLHGDLTPSNILRGDDARLVAIDPAPCVGDPAFDAIDLILWQATDRDVIEDRTTDLASRTRLDARRMFAWCIAFAGMTALERATQGAPVNETRMLASIAAQAPVG
jgi:streptomycin 6-kinase